MKANAGFVAKAPASLCTIALFVIIHLILANALFLMQMGIGNIFAVYNAELHGKILSWAK